MTRGMRGAGGTVLAIDIGGTLLKGAVVTTEGTAIAARRVETAAEAGPDGVAGQLEQLVRWLSARAASLTGHAPLAAGLVAPGAVDADTGVATFAANIPWSGLDLRARVRAVLDVPVVLGHDGAAGALAEATYGAAKDAGDFLFVALGTGIGGAVVLDGRPYRGAHRLSGELGHIQVRPDGPRCGCGEVGCLETLASAAAVRRRYEERGGVLGGDGHASDVFRRAAPVVGGESVDGRGSVDGDPVDGGGPVGGGRAAGGADPAAIATRDEAVEALAGVLTGIQRLLDLDLVVIGGGLAAAGDALIGPLATELARRAAFQRPPRVRVGSLAPDAGAYGAAVLAWEEVAGLDAFEPVGLSRPVLDSSPAE